LIEIDTATDQSQGLLVEQALVPRGTGPGCDARSAWRGAVRRVVVEPTRWSRPGAAQAMTHGATRSPMRVSGERFDGADSPQVRRLQTLGAWHARFPESAHQLQDATSSTAPIASHAARVEAPRTLTWRRSSS
jgi:hypothetical protein